jgi:hypothetical protein
MPNKKTLADRGIVRVTFELPAEVQGSVIHLVGDFTGWEGTPMEKQPDGSWRTTVDLAPDGTFEFRYLIDGTRWENDWDADRYVANAFGQENSVITTPTIARQGTSKKAAATKTTATTSPPKKTTAVTAPAKKRAAKKATTKKATTKKATARKTTAVTSPAKKTTAKKTTTKKTTAKKTTAKKTGGMSPKKPSAAQQAGPGSTAVRGSTGGSAPGEPLPMAASPKRGTTEAERDA